MRVHNKIKFLDGATIKMIYINFSVTSNYKKVNTTYIYIRPHLISLTNIGIYRVTHLCTLQNYYILIVRLPNTWQSFVDAKKLWYINNISDSDK